MGKLCRGCGEAKELDQFDRDRNRPDGRHSRCKLCRSIPCSRCGKLVRSGSGRSPETVCQSCRQELAQRTCEQCGQGFKAVASTSIRRFCSLACHVVNRTIYDDPLMSTRVAGRIRRLRHAETWDGVEDSQIFERDGWACKIPGCELGPIQRDQAWPGPLSPVIDHIVPLSLGGADVAPNKRAAHNFCNLSRNNRMHLDDVQIITPELAPLGLLTALKTKSPKPPKLCGVCETEQVKTAGATCASCRRSAQAERQQRALALREQGMSWAKIAVELGLSGPGAACNVANPPWDNYDWSVYEKPGTAGQARKKDRPPRRKTTPAAGQEERLWWTTVRP